jgi:RNA polymerase sigma-70 factor (ECF subfamily)
LNPILGKLALNQERDKSEESDIWVSRVLEGDEQAFDRLVANFEEPLYRSAVAYLGDKVSAEDAVQNTFVALWQNPRSLRNKESLRSWLFATLFNQCRKYIRGVVRQRKREEFFGQTRSLEVEAFEEDDGREKMLRKAMDSLNDEAKRLVVLKYNEKMSIKEISRVIGIPEGTCKSRLSRTLEKMRKVMEVQR